MVTGSRPRGGGLVDFAVLRFERTTAGSETIDDCAPEISTACSHMYVLFNGDRTFSTSDDWCALSTGTLVLTEISSSRAKGTFSGTGGCIIDGVISGFTVTNGTFDVPLVAPPS